MKPQLQEILRARAPDSAMDIVISLSAKGIWTVVYQGQPFQIRRESTIRDEKKYIPNAWSQRGSAERQAQYLNRLFHTTDFEIAEIQGKTRT